MESKRQASLYEPNTVRMQLLLYVIEPITRRVLIAVHLCAIRGDKSA